MGNVDALKELFKALGGSADDVAGITTNPEMILAIADIIGKSGGILPAVTATDNGSVLKVADGAWAVGEDATE